MSKLLAVALTFAATVHGAGIAGPSQFYAVSVFFSDNGVSFYYRILHVKQDGAGSIIRYIRIAPMNVYCSRTVVRAIEKRVSESPERLVGSNNPCAVNLGRLRAALKRYRRSDGVLEAISFGIVAQCGQTSSVLGLPIDNQVDMKGLASAHPAMARLWNLTSEVTGRMFGEHYLFRDRTDEEDAALQSVGARVIPEIISGQYDPGLNAAFRGNVETRDSPSFRSLLADYRGPISAAEAKAGLIPQLLNLEAYRFSKFVPVTFPPLALQARIEGRVELQLTVEPSTGRVDNVHPLSGHPLLTPPAVYAARQWVFVPNSVSSGMLTMTVEFARRCP